VIAVVKVVVVIMKALRNKRWRSRRNRMSWWKKSKNECLMQIILIICNISFLYIKQY
jgi:hypothetical protein